MANVNGKHVIRRIRILEYIGTESWVNQTIQHENRWVNGTRVLPKVGIIREYVHTDVIEAVDAADLEVIAPAATKDFEPTQGEHTV